MKKWLAIHPGKITYDDGDEHYISAPRLMELYRVNPDECIVWDRERPETYLGRRWKDYEHLYPAYNY